MYYVWSNFPQTAASEAIFVFFFAQKPDTNLVLLPCYKCDVK